MVQEDLKFSSVASRRAMSVFFGDGVAEAEEVVEVGSVAAECCKSSSITSGLFWISLQRVEKKKKKGHQRWHAKEQSKRGPLPFKVFTGDGAYYTKARVSKDIEEERRSVSTDRSINVALLRGIGR